MMNRRNFIKSSMVLSSALLANSNWVVGDRVKFAYYYPSETTPAPLQKFTQLFEKAGINAEMENLTGLDVSQVLGKLQSGEYAGVFMLTNLVSEQVPELTLLSDGPDAPSYVQLNNWFSQREEQWDVVLKNYNLKRIPFTHSGSRRGLWVHQNRIHDLSDLKGTQVYAEGLWSRIFTNYGAQKVERLNSSQKIDVFVPSNLYAAEQTGIAKKAYLHLLDEGNFNQAPGSSFDLYLNARYWNELDPKIQRSMKNFTQEVGEALCQRWEAHDERLLTSFKEKKSVVIESLSVASDQKKARQLRNEISQTFSSSQLVDSFNRAFKIS